MVCRRPGRLYDDTTRKKAAEGTYDGELNILMLSDAGRNGSYDQRLIGEWMGVYADLLGPEFVISCGDLFHYEGIQSTSDPLLWSNFESIYTHGELQCPWYGVLGNHEYRGNTQAMIDYSQVSRRWNMPARYYTFAVPLDDDKADSDRVRSSSSTQPRSSTSTAGRATNTPTRNGSIPMKRSAGSTVS